MEHEDGYCDDCGAEVDVPQLTVDGRAVCEACVSGATAVDRSRAKRPEARDDGR